MLLTSEPSLQPIYLSLLKQSEVTSVGLKLVMKLKITLELLILLPLISSGGIPGVHLQCGIPGVHL